MNFRAVFTLIGGEHTLKYAFYAALALWLLWAIKTSIERQAVCHERYSDEFCAQLFYSP
jgi:hypothetical protein